MVFQYDLNQIQFFPFFSFQNIKQFVKRMLKCYNNVTVYVTCNIQIAKSDFFIRFCFFFFFNIPNTYIMHIEFVHVFYYIYTRKNKQDENNKQTR